MTSTFSHFILTFYYLVCVVGYCNLVSTSPIFAPCLCFRSSFCAYIAADTNYVLDIDIYFIFVGRFDFLEHLWACDSSLAPL